MTLSDLIHQIGFSAAEIRERAWDILGNIGAWIAVFAVCIGSVVFIAHVVETVKGLMA